MLPDGPRPPQFWAVFNAWFRQHWDTHHKRPSAKQITDWFEENAPRVWPNPAERPDIADAKNHAKGLRTLNNVRSYFRSYRKRMKEKGYPVRRTKKEIARRGAKGSPGQADDWNGSGSDSDSDSADLDDDRGAGGTFEAKRPLGPAASASPSDLAAMRARNGLLQTTASGPQQLLGLQQISGAVAPMAYILSPPNAPPQALGLADLIRLMAVVRGAQQQQHHPQQVQQGTYGDAAAQDAAVTPAQLERQQPVGALMDTRGGTENMEHAATTQTESPGSAALPGSSRAVRMNPALVDFLKSSSARESGKPAAQHLPQQYPAAMGATPGGAGPGPFPADTSSTLPQGPDTGGVLDAVEGHTDGESEGASPGEARHAPAGRALPAQGRRRGLTSKAFSKQEEASLHTTGTGGAWLQGPRTRPPLRNESMPEQENQQLNGFPLSARHSGDELQARLASLNPQAVPADAQRRVTGQRAGDAPASAAGQPAGQQVPSAAGLLAAAPGPTLPELHVAAATAAAAAAAAAAAKSRYFGSLCLDNIPLSARLTCNGRTRRNSMWVGSAGQDSPPAGAMGNGRLGDGSALRAAASGPPVKRRRTAALQGGRRAASSDDSDVDTDEDEAAEEEGLYAAGEMGRRKAADIARGLQHRSVRGGEMGSRAAAAMRQRDAEIDDGDEDGDHDDDGAPAAATANTTAAAGKAAAAALVGRRRGYAEGVPGAAYLPLGGALSGLSSALPGMGLSPGLGLGLGLGLTGSSSWAWDGLLGLLPGRGGLPGMYGDDLGGLVNEQLRPRGRSGRDAPAASGRMAEDTFEAHDNEEEEGKGPAFGRGRSGATDGEQPRTGQGGARRGGGGGLRRSAATWDRPDSRTAAAAQRREPEVVDDCEEAEWDEEANGGEGFGAWMVPPAAGSGLGRLHGTGLQAASCLPLQSQLLRQQLAMYTDRGMGQLRPARSAWPYS